MNSVLLASLAALVIGQLVFERMRRPWALAALDAFALVAVGGLVSVHILPQCFARGGWLAAPVARVRAVGAEAPVRLAAAVGTNEQPRHAH